MTRKSPSVHEGLFPSPAEPPSRRTSSGQQGRARKFAAISTVALHPVTRLVLLLVALACQVALLTVTAYLIDLALDLIELWLVLARKHLEITL